jgi:hypothetical protein
MRRKVITLLNKNWQWAVRVEDRGAGSGAPLLLCVKRPSERRHDEAQLRALKKTRKMLHHPLRIPEVAAVIAAPQRRPHGPVVRPPHDVQAS